MAKGVYLALVNILQNLRLKGATTRATIINKQVSLVLVFLLCFSLVTAIGLDNPNLPIVKFDPTTFNNNTGSVNNSIYWQGYTPTTLPHNLLTNLAWSVAGHTMDTNLDMNDNNIVEIDKAYFDSGAFISSDDPDHLDLHADSIDLRGNLSTIWNIRLTDSDGTDGHNNIMLGGGRDAWIYYNATDLIIDPDVVGDGDVIILGDIVADNFIGNGSELTNLNVTGLLNVTGDFTGFEINISFLSGANGIGRMDLRGDPWWLGGVDLQIAQDLIVDGNTSSDWFNGQFNWTTGDTWNSFDGSILLFNETFLNSTIEAKIASVEYNASVIVTLTGNLDGGVLSDVLIRDDIFYNVSEVTGAPGFDIHLNYTGVASFNNIVARLAYMGSPTHIVMIDLLDCVSGLWDEELMFTDTDGVVAFIVEVLDPQDHICGLEQNVSLRVRHDSAGNPSHDIFIDAIHLVSGAPTSSPNEVDPLSLHLSGDTPMQGTLNMAQNSIANVTNISADLLISSILQGTDGVTEQIVSSTGAWTFTANNLLLLNLDGGLGVGNGMVTIGESGGNTIIINEATATTTINHNLEFSGNNILGLSKVIDQTTADAIDIANRILYDSNGNAILDFHTVNLADFLDSEIKTTGKGDFGELQVDNIEINGNIINNEIANLFIKVGSRTQVEFKYTEADFKDLDIVTTGNVTTNGLNIYDSGEDKTMTFIYDRTFDIALNDATVTWSSTAGDHEIFLSNWNNEIIGLDQDLRHNAAAGAEFAKLTVTGSTPTLLRKLQLGDTDRGATAGLWVLDSVGVGLTDPVVGSDGADGEGHYFEGAIGQSSQFAGTSGDGGSYHIVIGTKGIGLMGASDGEDGNLIVINLPTSDPSVAGAIWSDSGTLKISSG